MGHDAGALRTDKPEDSIAAFHARGERAWQEYVRTGIAVPEALVFDRIEARIDDLRVRLARDHLRK